MNKRGSCDGSSVGCWSSDGVGGGGGGGSSGIGGGSGGAILGGDSDG